MTTIAVYADWDGLDGPRRLGVLHAQGAAGREVFEFEFDAEALADPDLLAVPLDPHLLPYEGRQHPPQGRTVFGVFADASPDRWGRLLMQRRLEREQRAGQVAARLRLHESDYLLGVHDAFRVGALRFKRDDEGDFLDTRHGVAAPPFVQLRELEAASKALERDEQNIAAKGDEWLRLLIAPGGSLGGARPKATAVDPQGQWWIAKFPSTRDEHNVGAWELIVQTLASQCGITTPRAQARKFSGRHHTFLVERFDRTSAGCRLHFASAMTLTDHQDGDDASTGASYLELAAVLIRHGAQPNEDLAQLWKRIVFNMLVSNTDDHLRNHGFILAPGMGWRLSKAYDMNPAPASVGLRLNVSQNDNALDLELARSVASVFRVNHKAADTYIEESKAIVAQWSTLADRLRVPQREQDYMANAFALARD